MTTWLLNSAVLAAGAYGRYEYGPAEWDDVAAAMRAGAVSRIGYQETATVIGTRTGLQAPPLSREASVMAPGDVAYVVRLRYRVADPGRKGAATGAVDDDWEVAVIRRLA